MRTADDICLDARDITPTKAFGLLKASVVPRPIAWTSTVSTDGVNNLAPFSFFTVVSSGLTPVPSRHIRPHRVAEAPITSGACNFIEIIYPNELFPTAVRATATGTVVAISRVGSAVSTFVLPMVLTGAGLAGVMWLLAGVNVAGLAVTLLLGEETRGRALSETSAASPNTSVVPNRMLADDLP